MPDYSVQIKLAAQDQASQPIRNVNQELNKLDDNAQTNTTGMSNLGGVLKTVGTALVGMQILEKAGQLNELGQAANNAERTFTELSGGQAAATASLNGLRAATGGLVDDMVLMGGANRLLLMNLAQTNEEAASLTQIATTLGRAMGNDAGQSVADFASLLANQSIPRLDNFGISSDAVREKIEKLKAAGMGAQEAFSMAVMEEGRKALDKLGSSADTAESGGLTRLQTRIQNITQDMGQWVNEGINKAAGGLESLIGIIQAVGEHGLADTLEAATNPEGFKAGERAAALADQFLEYFYERMDANQGEMGVATGEQWQQSIQQAFEMVEKDPSLKDRWGEVVQTIFNVDPNGETGMALAQSLKETYRVGVTSLATQQSEIARFAAMNSGAGLMGIDETAARKLQDAWYRRYAKMFEKPAGAQESWFAQFQATPEDIAHLHATLDEFQYAKDKLTEFSIDTQGVGKFMRPEDFEVIKKEFEELQALNDKGLITDESLQKASEFKDQAEAAAKAFKDMSLTDIFGQTSGGVKGEIGDMVVNQLKSSGMSEDQIAAIQQKFDLGSGRETAASVAMQNTVVPMIAELSKTDPAKAQQAIDNVNAFLEAAAGMNLTPEQIAKGLPSATGFAAAGAAGSFTVKSGDTLSAIAAILGIPVEVLLAATGASSARTVQPGTYNLGTGFAPSPYNPLMAAQGIQGPMPGDGGQLNPFSFPTLGLGATPGGMGFSGQTAGAEDPLEKMKEDTLTIADNQQVMIDKAAEFHDQLNAANDTLDLVTKPRQAKITLSIDDQTGGILAILTGGVMVTATPIRNSPVQGGDTRVGGRPGGRSGGGLTQ